MVRYLIPYIKESDLKVHNFGCTNFAVGIQPHSNEPLGYVAYEYLLDNNIFTIANIDPPKNMAVDTIFNNFWQYLDTFELPKVENQVEFSYTLKPQTQSQLRAFQILNLIKDSKLFINIHNDPFGDFGYFYVNDIDQDLENIAKNLFCNQVGLSHVEYTIKLSDHSYKFFPASVICKNIETEACGIFVPDIYPTKVINVELPMFDWSRVDENMKGEFKKIHIKFWFDQKLDRREFISKYEDIDIPIVDPFINFNFMKEIINNLANRDLCN